MDNYIAKKIGNLVPLENIKLTPLYYIAAEKDEICSYSLIEPLKFKDFKLPASTETFSYPWISHDDLFKSPSNYADALESILSATSLISAAATCLFPFLLI